MNTCPPLQLSVCFWWPHGNKSQLQYMPPAGLSQWGGQRRSRHGDGANPGWWQRSTLSLHAPAMLGLSLTLRPYSLVTDTSMLFFWIAAIHLLQFGMVRVLGWLQRLDKHVTEGKALFVVGSSGGGNVFVFVSPALPHPSMKKEKKRKKKNNKTPTCTNSHRPNQTQCPGYRPIFKIYVMLFPTTEVQVGNSVCTLYGRNCRWEHEALCSTLHPATEL